MISNKLKKTISTSLTNVLNPTLGMTLFCTVIFLRMYSDKIAKQTNTNSMFLVFFYSPKN